MPGGRRKNQSRAVTNRSVAPAPDDLASDAPVRVVDGLDPLGMPEGVLVVERTLQHRGPQAGFAADRVVLSVPDLAQVRRDMTVLGGALAVSNDERLPQGGRCEPPGLPHLERDSGRIQDDPAQR